MQFRDFTETSTIKQINLFKKTHINFNVYITKPFFETRQSKPATHRKFFLTIFHLPNFTFLFHDPAPINHNPPTSNSRGNNFLHYFQINSMVVKLVTKIRA